MAGLLDHTLHMPRPLARSDTANYYVAQRDIGRRDLGSSLPPQRAQQPNTLAKPATGGRVASSWKNVEKSSRIHDPLQTVTICHAWRSRMQIATTEQTCASGD